MKSTQLCCRFSIIPNKLSFCGPSNCYKTFTKHLKNNNNEQEIKDLLTKFEGLYPYLQLIAEKHNLSPFDYKVIEAYWLGNELLDAFTNKDLKKFFPELHKRGLPSSIVEKLIKRVSKDALPMHTYNVLFVGVGQITNSVPTTLINMQINRKVFNAAAKLISPDYYKELSNNRTVENILRLFIRLRIEEEE